MASDVGKQIRGEAVITLILGLSLFKDPRDAMSVKNSQGRGCGLVNSWGDLIKGLARLAKNLNNDRNGAAKKNVNILFYSIFL